MRPLRERLDPEVAAVTDLIPFDDVTPEVLAQIRGMAAPPVPPSDAVARIDHVVPGDPAVPVRVYRPVDASGALPCVYFMHGGGYVFGTNSQDDATFDGLSARLGIVVVSVGYRLAPETPFPGPLDDCVRGLRWTHEHAADLGIDPGCMGIMGSSAGGGLAAALVLLARDDGEVHVAFQALVAPMLDDRQTTRSSCLDGLPVWTHASNAFGWRSYLGDLYGTADVPAIAAAARATDLSGLPPAFVAVGAIDGFCDEDVDYALRLNQAGVETELHVYPGACHGFDRLAPDAPVTRRFRRDMEDWLARQLGAVTRG